MYTWTSHTILGVDSGDTTATDPEIEGWLDKIVYEADPSVPYAGGATITVELVHPSGYTAEPILSAVALSASFVKRPRLPVHGANGTAISGGFEAISLSHFGGGGVRLKVTNGGTGKSGNFLIVYRRR